MLANKLVLCQNWSEAIFIYIPGHGPMSHAFESRFVHSLKKDSKWTVSNNSNNNNVVNPGPYTGLIWGNFPPNHNAPPKKKKSQQ